LQAECSTKSEHSTTCTSNSPCSHVLPLGCMCSACCWVTSAVLAQHVQVLVKGAATSTQSSQRHVPGAAAAGRPTAGAHQQLAAGDGHEEQVNGRRSSAACTASMFGLFLVYIVVYMRVPGCLQHCACIDAVVCPTSWLTLPQPLCDCSVAAVRSVLWLP